jgi:amino acid transporter
VSATHLNPVKDGGWLVYAFGGLILVAVLTYFDVELSARILGVALLLEAAVLLVFSLVVLFKGGANGVSYAPLSPTNALSGANIADAAPGVGIFFALWSWVGFECTANYAEEAKDPKRMVPRATYIAVVALGVLYTLTSWAGVVGHGLDNASKDASTSSGTFFYDLATTFMNPLSKDIMAWLIITSTFACAMAFHTAATRYFYAMGREGIFNKNLGRTHPKWQSPDIGSLFQSAVAGVLIILFVVLWNATPSMQKFASFENAPYLELYGWFAILGTFWVLLMMALSGIATIAVFAKPENRNGTHWMKWLVAPVISSIGLAVSLYLLWSNIAVLGGGNIPVVIALPWVSTVWFVIGLVLAYLIKKRNPQKYEVLGRMLHSGL